MRFLFAYFSWLLLSLEWQQSNIAIWCISHSSPKFICNLAVGMLRSIFQFIKEDVKEC